MRSTPSLNSVQSTETESKAYWTIFMVGFAVLFVLVLLGTFFGIHWRNDPPFFHTTMTYEFEMLAKTFGWDEKDFAEVNQTALKAAYCDEATRAKIAKVLEPAQ